MNTCVNCGRSADEAPIIRFAYKDQDLGICTSCLPVLIHKPERLAGRLVDAGEIRPGEDHD